MIITTAKAGFAAGMSVVAGIMNIINLPKGKDAIEIAKSGNYAELVFTNGSITKLLSKFIVEPTIIISNSLKEEEVIDKLANIEIDIFAAYYLQAFEVLRTMYGMEEKMIIDVLGTSSVRGAMLKAGVNIVRNASNLSMSTSELLSNNDDDAKPKLSLERFANTAVGVKDDKLISYSSVIQKEIEITFPVRRHTNKSKNTHRPESHSEITNTKHKTDDITSRITSRTPGRAMVLEEKVEEIQENTEYVVLPILIKANVIYTDIENIMNMAEPHKYDKSSSYRFDEFRSGSITLSEWLFAGDLIKQYKKNKLRDKDALMNAIQSKRNAGAAKIATLGMKGYETNYNMYIINSDEKDMINKYLNTDIVNNYNGSQKFLDAISGLNITLVDTEYERVQIFTKDIKGKSDLSFKAIGKRKESSDNYGEIIKAIMANRPISF